MFKENDILMSCHGYNMIIHDYYKVLKATAKTVVVVEMEKESMGFMQCPQVRCGDEIDHNGKQLRRRIKEGSYGPYVSISDWEIARLCSDPKEWKQDNYMD